MNIVTHSDALRLQRHFDPEHQAQCIQHLHDMFDQMRALQCSLIATVDGHRLAAAHRIEVNTARLSAIVGSLCGLGETLVRETGHEHFRDVLITSSSGISVIQRLPSPGQRLIVLSACDSSTNLGIASNLTRRLANELARLHYSAPPYSDAPIRLQQSI
ncbi:MAG TPA: hypothetical protein VFN29_08100 [Chiayiivirga sp.]|nr:hypothetical protein [Chiayiivirga sp.]